MGLKREDISKLAKQIVAGTRQKPFVSFHGSEEAVVAKIEEVVAKNMREEMAIEDEVKKIMERYRSQIVSGSVDAQKIYMMIKKQVAKDRNFVL